MVKALYILRHQCFQSWTIVYFIRLMLACISGRLMVKSKLGLFTRNSNFSSHPLVSAIRNIHFHYRVNSSYYCKAETGILRRRKFLMKKTFILLAIIFIAPFIAGIYGILHDQISYTISHEYYTKFKFIQFHIAEALPYRFGVALVGWYATWWMGIPIGIILGLVGLIHKSHKTMFRVTMKSFGITMIIALVTGLIGLLYGELFLADKDISYFEHWFIPANLEDFRSFISVGSMHNFSYLGGLTGLIAGIVYQIIQKKKTK